MVNTKIPIECMANFLIDRKIYNIISQYLAYHKPFCKILYILIPGKKVMQNSIFYGFLYGNIWKMSTDYMYNVLVI